MIVLALNIFHHFLKHKDDYDALISFLKDIDIETMFFEPHKSEESQMIGAYLNYDPDEFVDFIKENSKLNCSKFIGKTKDGRKVYKLWK
jgi:hypothetical protein